VRPDAREWEQPGAFEQAPGVFRIPLPLPDDGLRAVNVYAVQDADRLVLVDGGWAIPAARAALDAGLRALGCTPADIARFLVTHMHRDHYSQALAIRREFGTRVALGGGELPSLREIHRPGAAPGQAQAAQLRRYGAHALAAGMLSRRLGEPVEAADWTDPDEWLEPSSDVGLQDRTLSAIATPGHTAGHVVFADLAGGLLFAGDHVLPHITPSIGFEPAPAELPLRDYLTSLATVRAMPDLRLLPAHGPVVASTHHRIDELLQHHEDRLTAIRQAVGTQVRTPLQVAELISWTRRGRTFASLDEFNQMLAVGETAAHLDLLVVRSQLTLTEPDGVRNYGPPDAAAPR